MIACVIYAAKSTEDRRGSFPDQRHECRAAIERDSDRSVVAEYTDEAFSAFHGSRGPGLIDAMQHAEELAQDGASELWALHSDRLARGDGRMGPDLRRAADDCLGEAAGGGLPRNEPARPTLKSSTGAGPTFSGRCTTMTGLARGLSRSLGVEVVDQTGLQGRWDFVLAYTALAPSVAVEPEQTSLPTVFAAVEEQLGLKLERNPRGSIEYVIIAAAHAPTEN